MLGSPPPVRGHGRFAPSGPGSRTLWVVRTMATKLEDFLKERKIDTRRIIAASADLERLRPEDRAIKLAQHKARTSEDKKKEGLAA